MIVLYLFLLRHIYNNGRNKWLTLVTVFLLISQLGMILLAYSLKIVVVQGTHVTSGTLILLAFSCSLEYGVFSIPHYMLAIKYREIVKRVPAILNEEELVEPSKFEKLAIKAFLAFNIIATISMGISEYFFRY
jgi:hypothetical protein